jgi:lysophospholipase L1-like esterase
MKNVLCFGDSNTYGTPPMPGPEVSERFDRDTRWPGAMAAALGAGWNVIEEGLPGRTTVFDDPIEGKFKNGRRYLEACLESHRPLDVIVLTLGTNDLKARFGNPVEDIAAGVSILASIITAVPNQGKAAKLLIVCPPPILLAGFLGTMFAGGDVKSRQFPPLFKAVAQQWGADFLDTGPLIKVSDLDGIHYEASQHAILAKAITAKVRELAG